MAGWLCLGLVAWNGLVLIAIQRFSHGSSQPIPPRTYQFLIGAVAAAGLLFFHAVSSLRQGRVSGKRAAQTAVALLTVILVFPVFPGGSGSPRWPVECPG